MPLPTDRGYAVIASNPDGTTTVLVCTSIQDGQPVGVFAKHVRAPKVDIDPGLELVPAGSHRHTTAVVEVFAGDGAIRVRAPQLRSL